MSAGSILRALFRVIRYHARMGTLSRIEDGVRVPLEARHSVGRAAECKLRLGGSHVSAHHAELRWLDDAWRVKDLGSLNGTYVDGERIDNGSWQLLQAKAVLTFGDPRRAAWRLDDDLPPASMLVPERGEPIAIDGDMVAVPTEAPEITMYLDSRGCWWLETQESAKQPIRHDDAFLAGGTSWRFVDAGHLATTELVRHQFDIRDSTLALFHSPDEEEVTAQVRVHGKEFSLGSRLHHYVALLLARQRLEDRAEGVPETSCGWVYQDEFLDQLKMDRVQLNLHIFRLRKQLALAGFRDAASGVERRTATRQLRLGFVTIEIAPLS